MLVKIKKLLMVSLAVISCFSYSSQVKAINYDKETIEYMNTKVPTSFDGIVDMIINHEVLNTTKLSQTALLFCILLDIEVLPDDPKRTLILDWISALKTYLKQLRSLNIFLNISAYKSRSGVDQDFNSLKIMLAAKEATHFIENLENMLEDCIPKNFYDFNKYKSLTEKLESAKKIIEDNSPDYSDYFANKTLIETIRQIIEEFCLLAETFLDKIDVNYKFLLNLLPKN